MKELLKEFLSYILVEGTTAKQAKQMNLKFIKGSRIYWSEDGEKPASHKTDDSGKIVAVSAQDTQSDKPKKDGNDKLPPEVTRTKSPERYMGGKPKKATPAKAITPSVGSDAPDTPTIPSSVGTGGKGKRALTANHGINPTEDTPSGIVQKLISAAQTLVEARRKGVAGIGGPVASYGEASLTDLANRLTVGGLQQGLRTFREENKERVETNRELITKCQDPDFLKAAKKAKNTSVCKGKNPNATREVGEMLGLDPEKDKEFIIDYLATRAAYRDVELERLKADPDSVFYPSGKKGFGQNADAAGAWAEAAFDGAIATTVSMQGSLIDSERPFVVIQSDTVSGGYDGAVLNSLEAQRDAATTAEDKAYYEEQIKAWEVAKFHDTMVVGEDSKGRMVVFHITNKKDNELKDIWNNATPASAMGELLSSFKAKIAEGGMNKLTKEETEGFRTVTLVMEDAVTICADASAAATLLWTNPDFTVNDDVVSVAHSLRKPKDYVANMGSWMDSPIGPRSARAKKDFDTWATGAGAGVTSDMRKVCKGRGSDSAKCTAERMKVMEEYMKTKPANLPPYDPVGKLLVKIGEEQIKRDGKSGAPSGGSLGACANVKRNEKAAVERAHKLVVESIEKEDAKICSGPGKGKNCKPNGPAKRMYLSQLMHSMHFDIMGENYDSHIGVVTGGRASRPSDFRQTLAERSGYSKNNPEPTVPPGSAKDVVDWRNGLKEHIINNAIVSADSAAIRIRAGGATGEESELIEDSWRTAGDSQKVQKNVGEDVRTGVIGLADGRRREESSDILRDSFK